MSKANLTPDAYSQAIEVTRDVDRMAMERVKAEEGLRKALENEEAAKERFRAVMDTLAGLRAAARPPPTSVRTPAAHNYLKDEDLGIKWRIAFHLLINDGVLKYKDVAEELWGPLERTTAKNRVNSHMQQLKAEGIVTSLGNARYEINQALLAEKSGQPLPSK